MKIRFSDSTDNWYDVDAIIVGDLGVHVRVYMGARGLVPFSPREYAVSHIGTGLTLRSGFPERFVKGDAIVATVDDLAAWAQALQAACPIFFATARDYPDCIDELMKKETQMIAQML